MLLQRLAEYADRIETPPERYQLLPVRYVIELDAEGQLRTSLLTDLADPASRLTRNGTPMLVPNVQRAVAVRPLLLVDKGDYVLGYVEDGAKVEREARVRKCHAAFRELTERCASATHEHTVEAVSAFVQRKPLEELKLPSDFDPNARIAARVDGILPFSLPTVQAFWASEGKSGGRSLTCLVCGELRVAQDRLEAKLKGIPGGQTSGTAIISANQKAFESYGLEASLVAPVCASCAKRFTDAANALLREEKSRVYLGGSVFVFWTREPIPEDVFNRDLLTSPDPEQVRSLLQAIRSGKAPTPIDDTAFFGLVLSGSGGRAVVRDWIDTTVGGARRQISTWFLRQRIVQADGSEPVPISVRLLAGASVRELEDLPRKALAELLRCALTGSALPLDLLARAVRRARVEQSMKQSMTHPRAALMKLVLASRSPTTYDEEDWMVSLEPEHPDPAYHCGRLLAVLGRIQHLAIPGAKATVIDRFYGAASSAPATVFGGLLRQAQPHLAKLERDRPAAHTVLEGQLEEVCEHLGSFPRTLTLEAQGMFALGYYHQQAHERASARRRAAAAARDKENES